MYYEWENCLQELLYVNCVQWARGIGKKLWFVTHVCHQSGWRWYPGRCSEGPAALSSPASCSGSTGSSCLGGPGQQRLTPAETRNLAGSERCPVRIPAPGEAHRSEIRAVTPPWHRGGCDHNQLSKERLSTVGCTCAPLSGEKTHQEDKECSQKQARPRKRRGWLDRKFLMLMVRGVNLIAASSSSALSPPLSLLRADAESHDAFRVLPCCGPAVDGGGTWRQRRGKEGYLGSRWPFPQCGLLCEK